MVNSSELLLPVVATKPIRALYTLNEGFLNVFSSKYLLYFSPSNGVKSFSRSVYIVLSDNCLNVHNYEFLSSVIRMEPTLLFF